MDMQDSSTNDLHCDKVLEGNLLCLFDIFWQKKLLRGHIFIWVDNIWNDSFNFMSSVISIFLYCYSDITDKKKRDNN